MFSKIKNMPTGVKAALVYTFASVFSRGLSMITLPIFTRIMTINEIGTVNIFNSWYPLLLAIISLSLTSGGFQAAMKDFPEERSQYQSSVLTITTGFSIIVAIVYFCNISFWNNLLGLPTELCVLMLGMFILMPAQEFWLLRQRYENKYKLVGFITIGTSLFSTLMAILSVLYANKQGYDNIASIRLITMNCIPLLISLILSIYIFIQGKQTFNKKFWKYAFTLSLPLIGYSIANQILNVSDRIMIDKIVGDFAVGIYGTLFSVSSIFTLVWGAINSAFIPHLFKNISNEKNDIRKTSTLLLGAYAIIAIMMTYFAPEIVRIFATKEYYEAIYIMPPIAAGIFLNSVSNMYSNVLIYHKKTKYIMYSAILAAIVNVILNYILITKFGYMAAAYTTLIAHIVLVLPQIYFARKVHTKSEVSNCPIYNDSLIIFLMLITIIFSLLGLLLYNLFIIRYIIIIIGFLISGFISFKVLKKMRVS